jgi:hypothetical protein
MHAMSSDPVQGGQQGLEGGVSKSRIQYFGKTKGLETTASGHVDVINDPG